MTSDKNFVSSIISEVVYRSMDEIEVLSDWIAPELKSDKEFVIQCLKNDPDEYGCIFELVSDELKLDKNFMWDCLAINFGVFECVPDGLTGDKEFMIGCLKNHPDEYEYLIDCVSDDVKTDNEFQTFVKENFKVDLF